jgi:hypothetical protein
MELSQRRTWSPMPFVGYGSLTTTRAYQKSLWSAMPGTRASFTTSNPLTRDKSKRRFNESSSSRTFGIALQRVNGVDIPARAAGAIGSVDGNVLLSRLPPAQSSSIIEVKNQREWIYPRDPALWDIIRNGFAVNAVPILFARKIYDSAFVYVLERPRWDRDSDARSIRPRFDARGA